MIKGSVMRRLTLHLIVASLTFTTGIICSHLAHDLSLKRASVNVETLTPAVPAPPETERICEVHGSVLKAVRVQMVCGEYEGSYEGGWAQLRVGCSYSERRRMPLADAQFFLRDEGGLNNLMWWKEAEAAREVQFPHGYGWTTEDCESGGEPCAIIHSCAECRAAEVRWKRNTLKTPGR